MKKIYVHNPSHPGFSIHIPSIYFLLKSDYKKYGKQELEWITPIVRDTPVDQCFEYLKKHGQLDYFVISVYSWNEEHHLSLSKKVKETWPNCKIIAGGYQVTALWAEDPLFDTCVIGDPETIFAKIVDGEIKDKLVTNYLKEWGSSSVLDNAAEIQELINSLAVKKEEQESIVYVYETNRGCPYGCTFCSWGDSNRQKMRFKLLSTVKQELDILLNSSINILRIADANFGISRDDIEIARHIAQNKRKELQSVDVSWAKNNKEKCFEIAKIFGPLVNRFKYGVQDIDDKVGVAIKRAETIPWRKAFGKFKKELEVPLRLDLIIGLPMQTRETFFNQLQSFMDWHLDLPDVISVCQILPNTEMSDPTYIQKYGLQIESEKAVTFPAYFSDQDKIKNLNFNSIANNSEYNVDTVVATNSATREDISHMIIFSGMCRFMSRISVLDKNYIDMYYNLFVSEKYKTSHTIFKNAFNYVNQQYKEYKGSRLNIPLFGVDETILCLPHIYFYASLMTTDNFVKELSYFLKQKIVLDANYPDQTKFLNKAIFNS